MIARILAPMRALLAPRPAELSMFEDALGVATLFLLLFAGLSIPAFA